MTVCCAAALQQAALVFDRLIGDLVARKDIWVATRSSVDSVWAAPINLGAAVNTAASETRPSLSKDGTQLLFGRTPGPEGSGDVYVTTRSQP